MKIHARLNKELLRNECSLASLKRYTMYVLVKRGEKKFLPKIKNRQMEAQRVTIRSMLYDFMLNCGC